MARVSQDHLDARRRQILAGAARCFARNGFHGTSIQDVLKEVGLSAGAVYRYFAGKDELIAAIADEAFEYIRRAFSEAAGISPPPTPDVLLGRVVRGVFTGQVYGLERRACAALIVQVWAESMRNEPLARTLGDGYAGMRAGWAELVKAYRVTGVLRADVAADDVARTMIATAQGFIAQEALFGGVEPEALENGLRGLMSIEPPRAG
ncbi:TetR/AcrR family transcriptional regulator [Streptomyces halstedii]|uniref:TetR/AcrR family transcriptional regulator n=1 Tax=Streptomyces TaxID=1883 RepID=UPI0008052016|nr:MULTISPECIES: TetR/AcrR family transcriptional regulator [unclassified Streptomyces]MYR76329.1 TetR family transcriptional regulator [Streptomyces sp. SID4925]SBV04618.1 transcriptional regulator, TetR family [Streptomyces sp. OspMP-M45]SCD90610.1 transcriptional regulator, TetR family [Streptomyces sp. PpalLS-921]